MQENICSQPLDVFGYHGTSQDHASDIMEANEFRPSRNVDDWLGHGIYFFQDAPTRAREWSAKRDDEQVVVIKARISLEDCLDFLDITWEQELHSLVRRFNKQLEKGTYAEERRKQIAGRETFHPLDCRFMNWLIGILLERIDAPCKSIRAAFQEGDPIFEDAKIFDRSHVQINVLDQSIIRDLAVCEKEV